LGTSIYAGTTKVLCNKIKLGLYISEVNPTNGEGGQPPFPILMQKMKKNFLHFCTFGHCFSAEYYFHNRCRLG